MTQQQNRAIEQYKRNEVIRRVGQTWRRKPVTKKATKLEMVIAYSVLTFIALYLGHALITILIR